MNEKKNSRIIFIFTCFLAVLLILADVQGYFGKQTYERAFCILIEVNIAGLLFILGINKAGPLHWASIFMVLPFVITLILMKITFNRFQISQSK